MKRITSRFPFVCNNCRTRYAAGSVMYWTKGQKPLCGNCPPSSESPSPAPPPVKLPAKRAAKPTSAAAEKRFRIDWSDLKATALRVLSNDLSDFTLPEHKSDAKAAIEGGSWSGYTRGQLERWLSNGFQTDAIHGLEDFIPPIREKRRFVFVDEGDEFHVDMALSGMDIFMSKFTKRDEFPGIAIDAEIGFTAGTDASVLNAYYVWLCRVAFSIESAGIDSEITLHYEGRRMIASDMHSIYKTVVRVKKENEQTDFLSWSAMLSPASLRGLMFLAGTLQAESLGKKVWRGHGNRSTMNTDWSVSYDPDTRTISVSCPWHADIFPEEKMTAMLRNALKQATSSSATK